ENGMTKVKTVRPVTPSREAKPRLAKKTGKRGGGPLDPVEDFNNPLRKDPEQVEDENLQADDPGDPHQAQVQNGLVLMQFVRVKPIKEKDGKRFLAMEFAVGLTDDSAELLGDEIEH